MKLKKAESDRSGNIARDISFPFRLSFLLMFIFPVSNLACKTKNLPTKEIIDTVRCEDNPTYSYSLYLPGKYSDTQKWPIIYVFDPGARGHLAVGYFQPAAERLGYIIACSNNSRNHLPMSEISQAYIAVQTDVETRFSIDSNRIYTSGFSGGARVAAMMALNDKMISGVIACGAGFPDNPDKYGVPSFNYIALVGNYDMNYDEMFQLEKKLNDLGVINELRVFDGVHDWPPSDVLEEAVEWQELQAMNKGKLTKDTNFINALHDKYRNRASFLLKQGDIREAVRCYNSINKDFPEMTDAGSQKKLDSLLESNDYKKSVAKWEKSISMEQEYQRSLIPALTKQAREGALPDSIRKWWKSQIVALQSLEKGREVNKQLMASRVINLLKFYCFEIGREYMNSKMYGAASVCYQVELLIEPENQYAWYLLARVYAMNNEKKESLRSLKMAFKFGFDDKNSIEKDPAFASLKDEEQFKKIMN